MSTGIKPAHTAVRPGATVRGESGTIEREYSTFPSPARPNKEAILLERKLQWVFSTLINPGLRAGERRCLMLAAGEMLLTFLAQELSGAVK